MGKKWTSNASWSNHPDTKDLHECEKGARAVCGILLKDYTPGNPCKTRGVCLKAWVTKEKTNDQS